jgi:hypothetical protein
MKTAITIDLNNDEYSFFSEKVLEWLDIEGVPRGIATKVAKSVAESLVEFYKEHGEKRPRKSDA